MPWWGWLITGLAAGALSVFLVFAWQLSKISLWR